MILQKQKRVRALRFVLSFSWSGKRGKEIQSETTTKCNTFSVLDVIRFKQFCVVIQTCENPMVVDDTLQLIRTFVSRRKEVSAFSRSSPSCSIAALVISAKAWSSSSRFSFSMASEKTLRLTKLDPMDQKFCIPMWSLQMDFRNPRLVKWKAYASLNEQQYTPKKELFHLKKLQGQRICWVLLTWDSPIQWAKW